MRAKVHFPDGTYATCNITNIQSDGYGTEGIAQHGTEKYYVSQSTTIKDAQGNIIAKEWDVIRKVEAPITKYVPDDLGEW